MRGVVEQTQLSIAIGDVDSGRGSVCVYSEFFLVDEKGVLEADERISKVVFTRETHAIV